MGCTTDDECLFIVVLKKYANKYTINFCTLRGKVAE